MKSVVRHQYGNPDVLGVEDVEPPVLLDDSVRVRVRAASVNRSDWETLIGKPLFVRLSGVGLRAPKSPHLGSDITGVVDEVGADVTGLTVGDEVLADTMWHGGRGFSEYVVVPERAPMVKKPPGVTWEQAASLPQAALLALQGLRYKDDVVSGHSVLIVGGGGGGGSFAIQMAKAAGAEVTAVDNGSKQEFMRSMGADHVIDYTQESYVRRRPFDRILDFVGARSLFASRRALRSGGVYAVVGGSMPRLIQVAAVGGAMSSVGKKRMGLLMAKPNQDDLATVVGMVADGSLVPAIDARDGLESVAGLLRDLGEGRLLGKGVVRV